MLSEENSRKLFHKYCSLFDQEKIKATLEFYETRQEWKNYLDYRTLQSRIKHVDRIFYGDSITAAWPLQEFFPACEFLNRAIPGDNVHGLFHRLRDDVLAYSPRQVFLLAGINGIDDPRLVERITALAAIIKAHGCEVFMSSILPLRHPDNWDRFQYQDKIVSDNAAIKQWAHSNGIGFIDYHCHVKDESGQLAADFAMPDGTHITFKGYCRMAEVLSEHL